MKRKAIMLSLLLGVFGAVSAQQQQQKKDSLVLEIRMDTTTFKYVERLIKENIDGRTATGSLLLGNILGPLYQFRLVPNVQDTVKQIPSKTKNK